MYITASKHIQIVDILTMKFHKTMAELRMKGSWCIRASYTETIHHQRQLNNLRSLYSLPPIEYHKNIWVEM
jgi:hypothetical protein